MTVPADAVLEEVLTYGPGEHTFDLAPYPWLYWVELSIRGGDGGAAADGTPGEPGEIKVYSGRPTSAAFGQLILALQPGQPGSDGGKDGQPASAVIALYRQRVD